MPKFQVILQPEAERNIESIFGWLAERSPQGAAAWYRAFEMAIERLQVAADLFSSAPESEHFEQPLRDILFKTRRGQLYRMLFTIQGSEVHVLYVRGPGQDVVKP